MANDQGNPVVDEIREPRRRIVARSDHESARLVAHEITLQELHADRLVQAPKPEEPQTNRQMVVLGGHGDGEVGRARWRAFREANRLGPGWSGNRVMIISP
jgi:hypothetical protein